MRISMNEYKEKDDDDDGEDDGGHDGNDEYVYYIYIHQYKNINTSSLCTLLTPLNGHDCIIEIRYC